MFIFFTNFVRQLKNKMAAELIYIKVWPLSSEHLLQKIRDFLKNLLLTVSGKECLLEFDFLFG